MIKYYYRGKDARKMRKDELIVALANTSRLLDRELSVNRELHRKLRRILYPDSRFKRRVIKWVTGK